jgi:hypothetical protein
MAARIDLSGQTINNIKIIDYSHSEKGYRVWNCECYCGNNFKSRACYVADGRKRSCGCFDAFDLSNQVIENIEFISLSHVDKNKQRIWNCRCFCGKLFQACPTLIRKGNTKSCGCLKRKMLVQRNIDNAKWKNRNTKLHGVWFNMINRCYNKDNPSYKNYGGRGIRVCKEWKNSFDKYFDWIIENLGQKPSDGHTLDRIDNNGSYKPGNVRWATWEIQAKNKRGKKLDIKKANKIRKSRLSKYELAKKYNVSPETIRRIINNEMWVR